MNRKQLIIGCVVGLILAALVYLQIRTWRHFDWTKFTEALEYMAWWKVLAAVGLIYCADTLRAFRWAIFLRPAKQGVRGRDLIAAQFIGFAGLALFGRPGELIRPYIIARKVDLPIPTQMAVWAVERIFDSSAVAFLLAVDLIFGKALRDLDDYTKLRTGGIALIVLVSAGAVGAFFLHLRGGGFADWCERRLSGFSPALGSRVAARVHAFREGLDTIHSFPSFLALWGISLSIWLLVLGAYQLVVHAYWDPGLQDLGLSQCVLLMCGSIAGGVLQLPVVGGGSQLATISLLKSVFEIDESVAVSCGILLWLVTFISVAPMGLALARREHLSLRKIEVEAQKTSEQ